MADNVEQIQRRRWRRGLRGGNWYSSRLVRHPVRRTVAASRVRQLRPPRSSGGNRLGEAQHSGVRRQPAPYHHRRGIRRIDFGQRADGVASVARRDCRGDRGKRCDDAEVDATPTRRGRAERRCLCAKRSALPRLPRFAPCLRTSFLRRRGDAKDMPFDAVIDGYFLTEPPSVTFSSGKAAHVPLLVGSNSQEAPGSAVFGDGAPTVASIAPASLACSAIRRMRCSRSIPRGPTPMCYRSRPSLRATIFSLCRPGNGSSCSGGRAPRLIITISHASARASWLILGQSAAMGRGAQCRDRICAGQP